MRIYRLCKEHYSNQILSGEGGLYADGRWHTPGHPIIYCASAEALAVLELRVHIGIILPKSRYVMHELEVKDSLIEQLPAALLLKGWDTVPHSQVSQAVGDQWLEKKQSYALRVPSIHSRNEFNILLNPQHKASVMTQVCNTWPYLFDHRLFQ